MGGKPDGNPKGEGSLGDKARDLGARGLRWWQKKGQPAAKEAVGTVRELAVDSKEVIGARKHLAKFRETEMYFIKFKNRRKFDVGIRKARSNPQEVSRVAGEAKAKLNQGIEALKELQASDFYFSREFLDKNTEYLDAVFGDMVALAEGIRSRLIDDQLKAELQEFKSKFEELKRVLGSLKTKSLPEGHYSDNKALNIALRLHMAHLDFEDLRHTLHQIRTVGGLLDDEEDEKAK